MRWIVTRDARQGKTLLPQLPLNSSVKDFGSMFAVVNIKKTITVILFSRKYKTEMSRQFRDILVLGALQIWSFLLLDQRSWPQPCHASSWIRPRSLRARSSPSSHLLEREVLEQCCMPCTWHCSIRMSAGMRRITRKPRTKRVPVINTSSTPWTSHIRHSDNKTEDSLDVFFFFQ